LTPCGGFSIFAARSKDRKSLNSRWSKPEIEREGRDRRCFVVFGRRDELLGAAHVAQLAEHVLGKDEVIGSNPIMGSSATGATQ
jgi:hypothetical protein